ncbi:MAG TPA: hypothetical protein VKM55_12755 [Candidatus Lokiarchaeia archaeon]|nr:hypothetical protein [Candidatus Lokiarchaeia archaeon]
MSFSSKELIVHVSKRARNAFGITLLAVLIYGAAAGIYAGILSNYQPTLTDIPFSLTTHTNQAFPIIVGDQQAVKIKLTTDSSQDMYLIAASALPAAQSGNLDYIIRCGAGQERTSDPLAAGTYYVFMDNEEPSTHTGTISYAAFTQTNQAVMWWGLSIIIVIGSGMAIGLIILGISNARISKKGRS